MNTPSRTLYSAARRLGMSGPLERLYNRDALQALLINQHGEAALSEAVASVQSLTVGNGAQLMAATARALTSDALAAPMTAELVRAIVRDELKRIAKMI